ncbi:collagen alpha-1(I) chain-like [Perognathus longimembris pacificus]|uniref:collagen alpha-1(I) chain-like n=1 Tax=Perognathus longimembris pacificus TaxID=214514 RepID=UPI0020196CC5|nr:collagen alpha-1(I) chain-like [Perognathus longimembris pacificus]
METVWLVTSSFMCLRICAIKPKCPAETDGAASRRRGERRAGLQGASWNTLIHRSPPARLPRPRATDPPAPAGPARARSPGAACPRRGPARVEAHLALQGLPGRCRHRAPNRAGTFHQGDGRETPARGCCVYPAWPGHKRETERQRPAVTPSWGLESIPSASTATVLPGDTRAGGPRDPGVVIHTAHPTATPGPRREEGAQTDRQTEEGIRCPGYTREEEGVRGESAHVRLCRCHLKVVPESSPRPVVHTGNRSTREPAWAARPDPAPDDTRGSWNLYDASATGLFNTGLAAAEPPYARTATHTLGSWGTQGRRSAGWSRRKVGSRGWQHLLSALRPAEGCCPELQSPGLRGPELAVNAASHKCPGQWNPPNALGEALGTAEPAQCPRGGSGDSGTRPMPSGRLWGQRNPPDALGEALGTAEPARCPRGGSGGQWSPPDALGEALGDSGTRPMPSGRLWGQRNPPDALGEALGTAEPARCPRGGSGGQWNPPDALGEALRGSGTRPMPSGRLWGTAEPARCPRGGSGDSGARPMPSGRLWGTVEPARCPRGGSGGQRNPPDALGEALGTAEPARCPRGGSGDSGTRPMPSGRLWGTVEPARCPRGGSSGKRNPPDALGEALGDSGARPMPSGRLWGQRSPPDALGEALGDSGTRPMPSGRLWGQRNRLMPSGRLWGQWNLPDALWEALGDSGTRPMPSGRLWGQRNPPDALGEALGTAEPARCPRGGSGGQRNPPDALGEALGDSGGQGWGASTPAQPRPVPAGSRAPIHSDAQVAQPPRLARTVAGERNGVLEAHGPRHPPRSPAGCHPSASASAGRRLALSDTEGQSTGLAPPPAGHERRFAPGPGFPPQQGRPGSPHRRRASARVPHALPPYLRAPARHPRRVTVQRAQDELCQLSPEGGSGQAFAGRAASRPPAAAPGTQAGLPDALCSQGYKTGEQQYHSPSVTTPCGPTEPAPAEPVTQQAPGKRQPPPLCHSARSTQVSSLVLIGIGRPVPEAKSHPGPPAEVQGR